MKIVRDFESLYSKESDPWNIGAADSDRYNRYHDLICNRPGPRNTLLDIGCGFGSFLARFHGRYNQLFGLEISTNAITRGRKRYPFIHFETGSAVRLQETPYDRQRYDTIIYSDVIYYLDEKDKGTSLEWISRHLNDNGLAFIAAFCPGGNYLTPDELRRLVQRHFVIEEEHLLNSEHAVYLASPRKTFIAVTVDCETWHPIPEGKTIDWGQDILAPVDKLTRVCSDHAIPLTLMAEMGEFFWLREFNPATADSIANCWREAVQAGHDVQLHLHPNWLPELGAGFRDGQWHWDWSKARAADYPGDLSSLIRRCRETLETLLTPESPHYRVTCFRAGAYQAQPFKKLHDALVENGIFCDSSVYAGGVSEERGYDYRFAYHPHQPYFASRYDPQLKGPPAERELVELPIFTFEPNRRWFLDSTEGKVFAQRLLNYLKIEEASFPSTEQHRRRQSVRKASGQLLDWLNPLQPWLRAWLPRPWLHGLTAYQPEKLAGHEYFVMIGHTKADLFLPDLARNIQALKDDGRFEFVSLSRMADTARAELLRVSCQDAREEAAYQVKREYGAIMGEERNAAQSRVLQDMMPWDRERVLDLGCGAGYWSAELAQRFPWMQVTGVDFGEDFIAKARLHFASDRVTFQREDFQHLSFEEGVFDCVYADNVLEHAFDVDRTLNEIHRVLRDGGVLLAALPPDGYNPSAICDNHTWKTVPAEVRLRLDAAGFQNIEMKEVDTLRELGQPPYPPSNDRMLYLKAWRRPAPVTECDRVLELTAWVYRRLEPLESTISIDPREILSGGKAWCWGYACVLGYLLRYEGFRIQWLSLFAENHPRGRGDKMEDSHEVIQVSLSNGRRWVCDPMSNVCFPHSIEELVAHPQWADRERTRDVRYRERGYDLYATSEWYRRVVRYALRDNPKDPLRFRTVDQR
jgi:SAM-dependent methyltransferase